MSTSSPRRSPLARLVLAVGGIGVLVALAKLEQLTADSIGGARGRLAAVAIALAVFAACGLAAGWRQWRPRLTRPAPVRMPERSRDDLEPVNSLT